MYIVILNFLNGQVETVDVDKVEDKKYSELTDYDKVDAWIKDNVNQSVCQYMITENAPSIYNHNTQTTHDWFS